MLVLAFKRGVLFGVDSERERVENGDLVGTLLPFSRRDSKGTRPRHNGSSHGVEPHPEHPELPRYALELAAYDVLLLGGRSRQVCRVGLPAVGGRRSSSASVHRMARADYCGDGVPHTKSGTLIDLYDIHGIQTVVPNDGQTFEAGWNEDGAV